jgi:hypothetical protein
LTCLRAYQTSFLHDEAFTYLYSVRAPLQDVLSFSGSSASANNHLLNTLLMKISSYHFGDGELALRLPNVLAHALYLGASALLARRLTNGWSAIPAFLLLNTNPFMLDFFSLARGYGLALGFAMLALYFGLRCSEGSHLSPRFLLLSAVCGGLAVFANFSFLNFYLGLAAWLGSVGLFASIRAVRAGASLPRALIANLLPLALLTLGLAAVIASPLLKLSQTNQIMMGGKRGFWEDTVQSLILTSLYNAPYRVIADGVLNVLIVAVLLLNLAVVLWLLSRRQVRDYAAGGMALVVALISAVSVVLQHLLVGVNYPTDRAALSFVPLFGLLVIGPLWWLRQTVWRPLGLAVASLLVVLALASSLHALSVTKPGQVLFWRSDWDIKQMMQDLVADHDKPGLRNRTVTPGGHWYFEPGVNFYRVTWRLEWLQVYRRELPYARGDYYFLRGIPEDQRFLAEQSLVLIQQYEATKAMLARPPGRSASQSTLPSLASSPPDQSPTR